MADDSNKRKGGPGGERGHFKKSKGGGGNRWQTPNQKARQASQVEYGTKLGLGDAGLWVTYARGQRPRAVREFIDLCEEYGKSMYGIQPASAEDEAKDEDEGAGDIQASIEKELSSMKDAARQKQRRAERTFTSVNTGIECVFFLKAKAPVVATELARRMCVDARDCGDVMQRRCKYINRLIPVVDVDKATPGGIEKVGRAVLGADFTLKAAAAEAKGEGEEKTVEDATEDATDKEDGPFCTYAIRHNIRHNKELKSSELVKKVAGLVDERHKVNLTKPDKVILVEVFQLFCGMSVVDGAEWESLKRYNMNELYRVTGETEAGTETTKEETEAKDEKADAVEAAS